MKPGGTTPKTRDPEMTLDAGKISMQCDTDGSSIVYQTKHGGEWGPWQLYTKSFADPGKPVRAQACRLGYTNSETVELKK